MKMRAMLLTAGLAASVPMVTGAQTAADLEQSGDDDEQPDFESGTNKRYQQD
jgi:hypothetical protein